MLTIDLGGTKLLMRLHQDGQVVDRNFSTGTHFSPQKLQQHIRDLESEFNLTDYVIAMAFPGLLNGFECQVSHVLPLFNQFNLKMLSASGTTQIALNDVEAGMFGVMQNRHQVEILIMAGTGIGMGIAIDGKIFRGESGFSGELGSCCVPRQGNVQALDQFASGAALARDKQSEAPQLSLTQCGHDLGMAVSWVINCFNPGRIVFAGGMFNNEEYAEACFASIAKMSLPALFEKCSLEIDAEMKTIVVRGLYQALLKQNT